MKDFKTVLLWTMIAFLFGACLTIGTKTVNYFWPQETQEIIVKHVYEKE